MSLGAAFHNASSGLTVALKAVGATSSNLANALTEGYGKRDITIASRIEGGARVTAVNRQVNQRVQGQIWLSNSEVAGHEKTLKSLGEIDRLIGGFDDPLSLYELATRFETSLISLASRPDDALRQNNANEAGQQLAEKFRNISAGIQDIRTDAEKRISRTVTTLNDLLGRIDGLNGSIARAHGSNTAGLEDERQALIDQVSTFVPVKAVERNHSRVALMTPKGQFLLDQSAAELSIGARGLVTSAHGVEDGSLSLPILNGSAFHMPDSGELHAMLTTRDETAPALLAEISALARSLSDRLSDIPDTGPVFEISSDPVDLSSMAFTGDFASLDPSSVLSALKQGDVPFGDSVSELSSTISSRLLDRERQLGSANAKQAALRELSAADAVDTDTELQNLIWIEKIYTANAKALQVAGNMLDDLLKIG